MKSGQVLNIMHSKVTTVINSSIISSLVPLPQPARLCPSWFTKYCILRGEPKRGQRGGHQEASLGRKGTTPACLNPHISPAPFSHEQSANLGGNQSHSPSVSHSNKILLSTCCLSDPGTSIRHTEVSRPRPCP